MKKRPFSHSYTQVADFGLASTDGATIDSGKLPIKWTAPEVRNLIQDLQGGNFAVAGTETFSFLKQIRHVEFWGASLGDLLLWEGSLS